MKKSEIVTATDTDWVFRLGKLDEMASNLMLTLLLAGAAGFGGI